MRNDEGERVRGRRTGSRHFSEWSFDESHTLEINNRYSLIYITSTVTCVGITTIISNSIDKELCAFS
jgi:hypothetical protein